MKSNNLTTREKQIIALVSQGKTQNDIAGMLKISAYTVKSHMTSIFEKIGADNAPQAVAISIFSGYINTQH